MYLRLAFAVAAHLEPDILLVDEVLAVGDARFQRKCLGKMSDIAERDGRTVLVVSHNMGAIQRLCDRSLCWRAVGWSTRAPRGRSSPSTWDDESVAVGPQSWIDVSAAARRGTGQVRFLGARYTSRQRLSRLPAVPDGPLEFDEAAGRRAPVGSELRGRLSDRNGTKLVNADILTWGLELRLSRAGTSCA